MWKLLLDLFTTSCLSKTWKSGNSQILKQIIEVSVLHVWGIAWNYIKLWFKSVILVVCLSTNSQMYQNNLYYKDTVQNNVSTVCELRAADKMYIHEILKLGKV